MGCPAQHVLWAYADGRLFGDDAWQIRRHVEQCRSCEGRVYSGALPETAAIVRRDDGAAPAADAGPAAASSDEVPAEPSADAFTPGRVVGRYTLLGVLGQGGMSTVCAAYDPQLDRRVALKFLRGGVHNPNRARLYREAQAMARLPHPNVVPVHDVGVADDSVFVAMEFVDGTTVTAWLRERPRSWREVVAVFLEAGRGLAAAHGADLVHRDVKPGNLLIDRAGRVLVTDFGLACLENMPGDAQDGPADVRPAAEASGPFATPLTQAGVIMGTPAFMAPEQFRGGRADARADQFGFCVSLYWALYGELPFPASREGGKLPPVAEAPPGSGVPRFVRRILLRGLAEDPTARWPSMDALLSQLSRDPGRAARRWLYGGGAALCALVLGIWGVRAQKQQRQICAGAEAQLSGVWDAAKKAKMREAFGRIERPYAAQALDSAIRALDAYARDWVAMHTGTCEATRVRGEQSEELLDLRMECLHQRAQELGALTDLFVGADAKLVERAVQAAESLTPLDGCADAAALKAPVRLPSDPAARARVEAVRDRIARGQALKNAGKYKEGLAWMKSVVADARLVDHAPTEARALRIYGWLQRLGGDLVAAEATLKQALLAAERGRDDAGAAHACLTLVRIWIDRQPGSPEALYWGEHAAAWISRLSGSDPTLEVHLEAAMGAIYWARGDYAEAERHDQRGLVLAEKALGAESIEFAKTLGDLTVDFYEIGQFEKSLEYGERALAIKEKKLGPVHPSVGETLNNMALDLIGLGRLDDAVKTLLRADSIIRPVSLPSNPWLGEIQGSLGKTYELQGRYDDALKVLRVALADQKEPDGIANLTTGIGSVLNRQGKFAEALPLHEKALAIKEKAYGGPHRIMGDSLLGIGLARLGLGQPALALAPLERADKLAHLDRQTHGLVRRALAQALEVHRGGGDVDTRVRTLMKQARDDLAPTPQVNAKELAQIDAWLARRDEAKR